MSLLEIKIQQAKPRNFTTTEESDISCSEVVSNGFLWVEDDYVRTTCDDILEAISDNLYRITWGPDLRKKYGEFTAFYSLHHALWMLQNC